MFLIHFVHPLLLKNPKLNEANLRQLMKNLIDQFCGIKINLLCLSISNKSNEL